MAARDRIAPGVLIFAIVVNYVMHKTDWADTVCINLRCWLGTDTKAGKVRAVGLCLGFMGWFIPHLIRGPLSRDAVD